MATETAPQTGALSDRRAARLAGALYILGTAAGVGSLAVTGGLEGPDYLAEAADLGDGLPVGAVLVLTMGLSLAFIPIVVFPILRRTSERLAVGYVVFRSGLETAFYLLTVLAWVALFRLDRDDAAAGTAEAARALGTADDVGTTLQTFVFVIGATMFYWVLLRARLVPAWLSIWGLLSLVPYVSVAALGVLDRLDPLSTTAVAMQMPLAFQEMVLAVWLIVRGFSRPS